MLRPLYIRVGAVDIDDLQAVVKVPLTVVLSLPSASPLNSVSAVASAPSWSLPFPRRIPTVP